METALRVLARYFRRLWPRASDAIAGAREADAERMAAQARFWTELRAGQREAEANRSRPDGV